jgi:hypothetical protein
MSVLVALTGCDSSLVATDSRRVESDGTIRDDYPKTFRLSGVLSIGGHTGLLEFSGRTVPDWLHTLPLSSMTSLDALVADAKALFESQMGSIAKQEVSFSNRRADIVLVGHAGLRQRKSPVLIRALVLRPDHTTRRVLGEVRSFTGYCATGDDSAMNAVLAQIRALQPSTHVLPRKRLNAAAKMLIDLGVRRAGSHSAFPTVPSCGGPCNLIFL